MIHHQAANAVVVPVTLRIDVFSQVWLVKNKVVAEQSTGFFTPVAVQCTDGSVELVILPNRIQVTSLRPTIDEGIHHAFDVMQIFLAAAGSSLGPVQGAGLNAMVALDVDRPASQINRLFLLPGPVTAEEPEDVLLQIGHSFGERAKFTTKFVSGQDETRQKPVLVVDSNLHVPITDIAEIGEMGGLLEKFKAACHERIDIVVGRIGDAK